MLYRIHSILNIIYTFLRGALGALLAQFLLHWKTAKRNGIYNFRNIYKLKFNFIEFVPSRTGASSYASQSDVPSYAALAASSWSTTSSWRPRPAMARRIRPRTRCWSSPLARHLASRTRRRRSWSWTPWPVPPSNATRRWTATKRHTCCPEMRHKNNSVTARRTRTRWDGRRWRSLKKLTERTDLKMKSWQPIAPGMFSVNFTWIRTWVNLLNLDRPFAELNHSSRS